MSFIMKQFHKFETLIDKIKNLEFNLKYDINWVLLCSFPEFVCLYN